MEAKMRIARIFRNGRSQAVRLPKEFRFAGDRVLVKRQGNAVILLPSEAPWQTLVDSLSQFSEEFMAGREQPRQQERESAFT
mgnify:CR=1 FL=1